MTEPHALEQMLLKIDEKVLSARLAQLETVTAAISRGVPVFVHHQVKDGQPAFLVSPRDFKALQEYQKRG